MAWAWEILAARVLDIKKRYGNTPLSNFTLFLIQHVLDDLYHLIKAFIDLGSDPDDITVVGISYSSQEAAGNAIKNLGCRVDLPSIFPFEGCVCTHLMETLDRSKAKGKRLIILEDGGYAVSLISQLANVNRIVSGQVMGAVEQTSRGARVARHLKQGGHLGIPVVSIPDCGTKKNVEPSYIADAISRNLMLLLNAIEPDRKTERVKTLGIFGFGVIGDQVAKLFKRQGATVYVSDPMPEKRYNVLVRAEFKELTPERLPKCDLVLGVTGTTSIGPQVLDLVKHEAVLASASSRQVEIDLEALYRIKDVSVDSIGPNGVCKMPIPAGRRFHYAIEGGSKSVIVLYDGYPLNFWGRSLPDPVSDAILSLLLEGVVAVAIGGLYQPIVYTGDMVLANADNEISLMLKELKPDDGIDPWALY